MAYTPTPLGDCYCYHTMLNYVWEFPGTTHCLVLNYQSMVSWLCVRFCQPKAGRQASRFREREGGVFSPRDRSGSPSKAQSAKGAPTDERQRLATRRSRLCSPGFSSLGAATSAATARIKRTKRVQMMSKQHAFSSCFQEHFALCSSLHVL